MCYRIYLKIFLLKMKKMGIKHILLLVLTSLVLLVSNIEFNKKKPVKMKTPDLTFKPGILWWTDNTGWAEIAQCSPDVVCEIFVDRNILFQRDIDAYLFYGSRTNFSDLPLPRQPEDIWGLTHEESPRNTEELMHEEIISLFNFTSTSSRYSNIPVTLQYIGSLNEIITTEYFVSTQTKNEYLSSGTAPVLYLQSDCETSTERDIYVKELMKFVKVDSYGACLNNKQLPEQFKLDYLNNLSKHEFLQFVGRYKFVIAIENGVCNDYITEKFWRAIRVGSVPIYFGSPSIRDWLPNNKSAILIEDFPTPELLSEQLNKLLSNDTLYEGYLDHKTKQVVTNMRLKKELRFHENDFLKMMERFVCFVCERLHEKRKGLLIKSIASKAHYDCPKPISALSQKVNPSNFWVLSWESSRRRVKDILERIYSNND